MKEKRRAPSNSEANTLIKALWVAAGSLFVALGILGIVLPLLPTTPFLLLAGACYLRSSRRLYNWLITNKLTGQYIRNYQEGRGMPMRAKVLTLGLLWGTLIVSGFVIGEGWVRWVLLGVAIGVPVLILRIPTLRE